MNTGKVNGNQNSYDEGGEHVQHAHCIQHSPFPLVFKLSPEILGCEETELVNYSTGECVDIGVNHKCFDLPVTWACLRVSLVTRINDSELNRK